jgi:hypothetical protein
LYSFWGPLQNPAAGKIEPGGDQELQKFCLNLYVVKLVFGN